MKVERKFIVTTGYADGSNYQIFTLWDVADNQHILSATVVSASSYDTATAYIENGKLKVFVFHPGSNTNQMIYVYVELIST